MNILIADDHQLVRDMIVAFLESDDALTVSVADDMPGAAKMIAEHGPYDLVLLDYSMPGMDGLKGLAQAKSMNGGKPVGLISGSAPPEVAESALAAGAAGFLPKTMPAKSLITAIKFMAAGEVFVPFKFLAEREEAPAKHPLLAKLTAREVEVLRGLSEGRSNKEIARDLELQEVTVKLHVKTLCRKLEARNRTHAAMIAKDAGIA